MPKTIFHRAASPLEKAKDQTLQDCFDMTNAQFVKYLSDGSKIRQLCDGGKAQHRNAIGILLTRLLRVKDDHHFATILNTGNIVDLLCRQGHGCVLNATLRKRPDLISLVSPAALSALDHSEMDYVRNLVQQDFLPRLERALSKRRPRFAEQLLTTLHSIRSDVRLAQVINAWEGNGTLTTLRGFGQRFDTDAELLHLIKHRSGVRSALTVETREALGLNQEEQAPDTQPSRRLPLQAATSGVFPVVPLAGGPSSGVMVAASSKESLMTAAATAFPPNVPSQVEPVEPPSTRRRPDSAVGYTLR